MSNRYEELDSIRGLAALVVVFCHLFAVTDMYAWANFVKNTPFFMSHQAVMMFFVLSGFVLSLPFLQGKSQSYGSYAVRRICRIYIPYLVTLLLAILMRELFSQGGIAGLTDWFNRLWVTPLSWELVAQHVLFIGGYDTDAFNPVIWSLVHEMRISLIFPLLMILVVRYDWKIALSAGFALSCVGSLLHMKFAMGQIDMNYFMSVHYTFMFIIGACLAKHRDRLIGLYRNSRSIHKLIVLAIGAACYTYSLWFLPNVEALHVRTLEEWMACIGVSVFIIAALGSSRLSSVLRIGAISWIGRISYSLYLVHFTVLFTLVYALYGVVPVWSIWLVTLIVSIAAASLSYLWIEVPSIRLGRSLTRPRIAASPERPKLTP